MEFLFSISQKNNKKFYKLTADDKESAEKIFTAKMTPYIDQKFMDFVRECLLGTDAKFWRDAV